MIAPKVLEIKGNSLDDGPGIRTTIFFKGCPLKCVWCHNPESKLIESELSFDKDECIGCQKCVNTCKKGALSFANSKFVDRNKCIKCFECTKVCPSQALSKVGEDWTVDALFEKVLQYKPFYNVSGGGVTVSGGEATLFPEFVGELLKKCKENGIHTLLETCGAFNYGTFEKFMLPYVDMIYFDLKIADNEQHKKYCGTENKIIKENFSRLAEFSKTNNLQLLPRTPLIPNITDTQENLVGIANFLNEQGIKQADLLPYNPTWTKKNDKIGVDMPEKTLEGKTWQTQVELKKMNEIFTSRNIQLACQLN